MMPTVRDVIFASISVGIDGECVVSVSQKTTRSACLGDSLRSGNPGVSRRDHFISRFHSQTPHRNIERVRSVGAGNAVFDTDGFSPGLFKCIHVRASNKGGVGDHLCDRRIDLGFDAEVLRVQINKGNFHGHNQDLVDRIYSWRARTAQGYPRRYPAR